MKITKLDFFYKECDQQEEVKISRRRSEMETFILKWLGITCLKLRAEY